MYNPGVDQDKGDMVPTSTYQPQTSNPPEYPQPEYPQPGYPPQPSSYPPQSSGYPPQSPSYPLKAPGYPSHSSSYPPPPVQQQPTSAVSHTNTTVVIQQQATQVVIQGPRGWSTGVCACFDDCGVCVLGLCSLMCCMPIIECNLSSAAGECCCVGSCCPIALRTKIRTRHNIQGSIMDDCCTLACCYYCAMCQMLREVNTHGM